MLVAWTNGKQLGRHCLWWWWEGELKKVLSWAITDRGVTSCSKQEAHCQRSVPSGTLNAKDGNNLGFLPGVLGAVQDRGLEEVWTACGQVGSAEVVRPMRSWGRVVCTSTWAYPFTITSRSREAKPESQTGLGSKH